MSMHSAFRRQPVPQEYAQHYKTITIPAPTRGIIQHENEAFMQPGGAIVQDNWVPTMKGIRLRGGTARWCDLHALDAVVPPVPSVLRLPVISTFTYSHRTTEKMFAAQATKLFDVSTNTPVLVKAGQLSGNYAAAQMTNTNDENLLIAVNDAGDYPLRFNGTSWITLDPGTTAWAVSTGYVIGDRALDTVDNTHWRCLVAHTSPGAGTFAAARIASPANWTNTASDGSSWITGPVGSPIVNGKNLSYVWKYRNRLFFIELNSMNAWYLGIDSTGGLLQKIVLSGSATKGGKLLFGASWSIDAGDGIDDKCVFVTDLGEVLIFTGNNPGDPANWRQEGRYSVSPPLGMNAHTSIGGDLMILTVDGMVPLSQAIQKEAGVLELAMLTRAIKPLWRENVIDKRAEHWTVSKWDEYGGFFVATPGGKSSSRYCLAANDATGAWCRLTWDARCFLRMRADMFFGDGNGLIMQMDRTGYDDGNHRKLPYVCTLVGGWEMFQSHSQQVVWHQARAIFTSPPIEPFQPQLNATTDFIVTIPPPPPPGPDPGLADVWDQGLWDVAKWDAPAPAAPAHRNTMWVSIGMMGFSHAPIVQVTVAQQARPTVDLVAIAATFEQAGVNV